MQTALHFALKTLLSHMTPVLLHFRQAALLPTGSVSLPGGAYSQKHVLASLLLVSRVDEVLDEFHRPFCRVIDNTQPFDALAEGQVPLLGRPNRHLVPVYGATRLVLGPVTHHPNSGR